jgi:biotin synthase
MSSELLSLLVDKAFRREAPERAEALELLTGAQPLIEVVAAGAQVRRKFFGTRVKLNTIVNMKSGLCPEDCGYCSQRLGSKADVLKYSWITPDKAVKIADDAVSAGAKRVAWSLVVVGPVSVTSPVSTTPSPPSKPTILKSRSASASVC